VRAPRTNNAHYQQQFVRMNHLRLRTKCHSKTCFPKSNVIRREGVRGLRADVKMPRKVCECNRVLGRLRLNLTNFSIFDEKKGCVCEWSWFARTAP